MENVMKKLRKKYGIAPNPDVTDTEMRAMADYYREEPLKPEMTADEEEEAKKKALKKYTTLNK